MTHEVDPADASNPVTGWAWVAAITIVFTLGRMGYQRATQVETPNLTSDYRFQLDLNRASSAELLALPRIGPQLAERIVQHRQVNGPFHSIADLQDVPGIGQVMFDQLDDYLTVEPEANDQLGIQTNGK